jgi:chromosome segregation ATPase
MIAYRIMIYLAIAAACSGYFYYTQNKIDSLNQQVATFKVANEQNRKAIEAFKENAEKQQKQLGELSNKLQEAESYADQLQNTLRKHNLTVLAIKKPGLIEKRMNDGTKKLFQDFRDITSK